MGPPRSTHAKAPRKGGVTKEARISMRKTRLNGSSVRATSQPMGAAATTQRKPTAADVHSVVTSGFTKLASSTKWR